MLYFLLGYKLYILKEDSMKIGKSFLLLGLLYIVSSNALQAQEEEITVSTSLPSAEELQKTAQVGEALEKQVEKVDDTKLESVKQETPGDKEELEGVKKSVAEQKPGFFRRIYNYIPGIAKMVEAVTQFNKKAAENLTRFKVTFKNVSDSLASFEEDRILVPAKDNANNYVINKATKAVSWKLVPSKGLSTEEIHKLKQECLYIIVKEMVDGFKHLDPVVGKGITALSYLAPNASKQSAVVYEVATKFLPMLEMLAKESFETPIAK